MLTVEKEKFLTVKCEKLVTVAEKNRLTVSEERVFTLPHEKVLDILTQVLFSSLVKMPLLARRIHHTLSAGESCPLGAALGSSQTAAAGFLYIFGLTEFTEEKNEYHKKEELRRSG